MTSIVANGFVSLSEDELMFVDGGWSRKATIDCIVAVGCIALSCTGPGGAVVAACITVGYTVGRGL